MKKYNRVFISVLSLSMAMLCLSSCKDDEPTVPAKISFSEPSLTVREDDGVIEIEIILDKPAKSDLTIEYSLDGTAIDAVTAGTTLNPDYEIVGDYLEVTINEGETTGIIEIELFSDFLFEDPESIQIEIQSVDDGDVEITNDDDIEITVEQEDGLLVLLEWDYSDVDMDLFLWAEDNTSTLVLTSLFAARASYVSPEFLFLPNALDDGSYGLSCNYYEGTADPMNFTVKYITIVNSVDVSTVTKSGSYTSANINPWDDAVTGTDPLLVATYDKLGGVYSNFSEITIPSSGSRMSHGKLPTTVKKQK